MADLEVGVRCGQCGGEVYMMTCDHVHGTGHEWVLASICFGCFLVNFIESGCRDCEATVDAYEEQ